MEENEYRKNNALKSKKYNYRHQKLKAIRLILFIVMLSIKLPL